MARLLVSKFRADLFTAASAPVLVRTPKTVGYHRISKISLVNTQLTPLYPETLAANTELYVNINLEPLYGAGVVGPGSSLNFPDLTDVDMGYSLQAAIPAAYNDYNLRVGTVDGEFVCSSTYRRGLLVEEPTGISAFVFNLNCEETDDA